MEDQVQKLTVAKRLGFWAHWLIGGVLAIVGMLIENPSALLNEPHLIAAGFVFFGLLLGIISRAILLNLIPAPYAWLATRLGLASPAV